MRSAMPVYRHKGSPFYHNDFQIRDRRFHGSTKWRHHADSTGTWPDLERLVSYFGKNKLLADIGDDEVAQIVAPANIFHKLTDCAGGNLFLVRARPQSNPINI